MTGIEGEISGRMLLPAPQEQEVHKEVALHLLIALIPRHHKWILPVPLPLELLLQEQLIQTSRLDDVRGVVPLDDVESHLKAVRQAGRFTSELEAQRVIEQGSSPVLHAPVLPSGFCPDRPCHRSSGAHT